jgi:2,3-bisphosphoglycerate-independent phosphoglycerate mutase
MSEPLVCLVILDGWGIAPPGPGNAVDLASTPVFDHLWARYPHTHLAASGRAVGLPDGQMGNSEVGHTNLGAGRVVRQDLVRIDDDLDSGAFYENPVLADACRRARGSALHLLGLVSDGGVHSHVRHLRGLIELASREGVERVHVHAFTDGRDTSPTGGAGYLDGIPGVATVCGRYYAMDRDRRWDRIARAYDAIVHGRGDRADDPVTAVKARYEAGETDEFIQPIIIGDAAEGRIRAGDAAIFFNFRPDRARELTRALVDPGFSEFDRGPSPPLPFLVQMTEYADDIDAPVAFAGEALADVLAETLADAGAAQVHAAETEKYAHRFCAGIAEAEIRFGLVNFANPDMVGHTGVIPAAVAAVEAVDRCLARVVDAAEARGGMCLVTADHGNAELMLNPDGSPNTAHTTNPVPFIATRSGLRLRDGGKLADVSPTVLDLLAVERPATMSGKTLLA